jgi:NAD(P)-dependent dehydrogenase (short-subunit alcohol dehydrogenase family)
MSESRSVLVTGASTGIGEACARHLDTAGFRVFGGVRKAKDAARLREGSAITPVTLDVTDAASIRRAAREVDKALQGQPLHGLVNNAGIAVAAPLEYVPIEDLRLQFEVNVIGVVAVTQALLPALRRGAGRIVVIGSVAGRMSNAMLGPYAASKFAVEALCDAWRAELAPWSIEVSLVEPGEVATPIWDKGLEAADRLVTRMPPEALQRYGAVVDAVRRAAEKAAKNGASPASVADVVHDALTATQPQTRYLVGRDAKVRAWVALLPDRWRDNLVRRALGLSD